MLETSELKIQPEDLVLSLESTDGGVEFVFEWGENYVFVDIDKDSNLRNRGVYYELHWLNDGEYNVYYNKMEGDKFIEYKDLLDFDYLSIDPENDLVLTFKEADGKYYIFNFGEDFVVVKTDDRGVKNKSVCWELDWLNEWGYDIITDNRQEE